MPAKVIVLGIDAVNPHLLRRWCEEGHLQNLKALLERGTSGPTLGVPGFFIGSTWPSLYTGLGPAGHGLHYLVQLQPGSYTFWRPLESPEGIGGSPFWKRASDAGRTVAVLDVPLSRLEPRINGIQTVEWGGHDAVFGFQASSPAVAHAIQTLVGDYPLPANCDGDRQSPEDYGQFLEGLETAVRKRTTLTEHFLADREWDLFIQVFTEGHCAGHQCWHIHDPAHPAHEPRTLAEVGDPLRRVYGAIDRGIGQILAHAADAFVLVVVGHGMGPWRGAQFLLPELLFRLGVASPAARPRNRTGAVRARLLSLGSQAWHQLPSSLRSLLGPVRTRLGPHYPPGRWTPSLGVDPRTSSCFAVPNGMPMGGIRLNLVGREPSGILRPGQDTEEFCARLEADLREIVDARTGEPLVKAIHRTDSLHVGPHRDALPDLLVEWNGTPTGSTKLGGGKGATVRAHSGKIGEVEGSNDYGRSGEHFPEGMFIATGPGVPAGLVTSPVSILDFHPTLCRRLGLADPQTEGSVITELIGGSQCGVAPSVSTQDDAGC